MISRAARQAHLVLEDGSVYRGEAFGAERHAICHFERSREIQGAYTAEAHGPILCLHHDQRDQNAAYRRDERPSETVYEHQGKLTDGFTKKYNVTWLAYREVTGDVSAALSREKQLKKWSRGKKVALIGSFNPQWKDFAQDWYDD